MGKRKINISKLYENMKTEEFTMKLSVKVKRVLALSALTIFSVSTTVFAVQTNMEQGGYAYLNSNYSNGMRDMSAGTIRGNTTHMAYLKVTTRYQDGSEEVYDSGVSRSDKTTSSGYEWSEDYKSHHRLFTSAEKLYDEEYLSED